MVDRSGAYRTVKKSGAASGRPASDKPKLLVRTLVGFVGLGLRASLLGLCFLASDLTLGVSLVVAGLGPRA